ncbi:MAG: molybdate ABC transporter substrate-binding protein [Caldimonas sp.]
MKRELQVLCAGAVQGLVRALQGRFHERTGSAIAGRFGAVGAMKEALMGGVPCDVLIVTDAMLRALQGNGAIEADTAAPIGCVRTGVAGRSGEPLPRIDSPAALQAALLAAPAIYLPDIDKSTAGAHVASVLDRLGIRAAMANKLAIFANGATAMHALAEEGAPGSVGSTQISEILYTPGLALAGALPDPFGLSTVYSAGVSKTASDPALAAAFIAMLCGPETVAERASAGFEDLTNRQQSVLTTRPKPPLSRRGRSPTS